MTPKAQEWRDRFANCERDQLQRFPLCQHPLQELETPLLRSQYKIALAFFQEKWSLDTLRIVNEGMKNSPTLSQLESYRKATAFRADCATREAFYEHFALEPIEDYFCLRTEEWDEVFAIETQKVRWENHYTLDWHEFTAVLKLKPRRSIINAPLPDELPLESLFLRQWGTLIHPLGGDGGADLWHWNGEELVHLPKHDSIWIS